MAGALFIDHATQQFEVRNHGIVYSNHESSATAIPFPPDCPASEKPLKHPPPSAPAHGGRQIQIERSQNLPRRFSTGQSLR
jgi:hypothetical protein